MVGKKTIHIQVLVDNPSSWIAPKARDFCNELNDSGFSAEYIESQDSLQEGDILVLLGCEKLLREEERALHKHNLVVHESALPQGKGMSPLTWQILEGKDSIPITLFEAVDELDAGPVYGRSEMTFEGHELIDELRDAQAKESFALIREFLREYPSIRGEDQSGAESTYPRRTPKDSELDVSKSLEEQFNLLRVVDNDRYPAFFWYKGKKYIVRVQKDTSA